MARFCKKQRTGADQFQVDHHGEYEARGWQSQDRITRVRVHNNAYPKMYDELDKKRSMAKPVALSYSKRKQSTWTKVGPLCCRCLRQRNIELKQANLQSRSQQRTLKTKSRITKPKRRTQSYRSGIKYFKMSKIRKNKGCQYYRAPVETKSVSTYDDDSNSVDEKMAGTSSDRQFELNQESQRMDKLKSARASLISIKDGHTSNVSQKPGTSAPSLSSYNSYLSMDHEPMVQ